MKKPVFAMLLGGFLGVFDGLSALVSGGPQEPPNIVGIVVGLDVQGRGRGLDHRPGGAADAVARR